MLATIKFQDVERHDAVDAVARKRGMNPRRGGLELRKYIAIHTDTMAMGPTTARDYLAWIGEK